MDILKSIDVAIKTGFASSYKEVIEFCAYDLLSWATYKKEEEIFNEIRASQSN